MRAQIRPRNPRRTHTHAFAQIRARLFKSPKQSVHYTVEIRLNLLKQFDVRFDARMCARINRLKLLILFINYI